MPTDKRPLKVFLCHSSTDKPKVRELYRYLKKRGIQPWFDEEDLVGGQDWQVEIPKALATSDAIIICLTKNSVDKEGYIQKEIKFALDKALEMPEGRIFLIPVKFEECEVPFTLSRYQWVDLTVDSGYAKMMKAFKFRASQLERSTVEVIKRDISKENLVHENKEPKNDKLEGKEPERKTFFSEAVVADIDFSGNISDSEQTIPAFLLPKALENDVINKLPEAVQSNKLKEKISQANPKLQEHEVIKQKSGVQIIYWLGGFIVLALGIILLLSLNNLPSTPQPTAEITQTQASATLIQNVVAPSATTMPKLTSTAPATQTPTPLPTEITDTKGVTMRLVPAGEFVMGSDDIGSPDEQPVHQVYLDAFYMDIYEVTNADYKACVDAGVCDKPKQNQSFTRNYYYGNSQFNDYPVIYVNWNMSKTYCEWRGGGLPTEAQWEKAARGSDGRTYPWGEGFSCKLANIWYGGLYGACVGDTAEVGSYESGNSPFGIYDLAGNVWEWVADWYDSSYYVNSPSSNPLGPNDGTYRVMRGGSWDRLPWGYIVRSTDRNYYITPKYFNDDIGFRCAKDIAP